MRAVMTLPVALFFITGCHEGFYNNVQQNHQRECQKIVSTEYADCMAQYDLSYDEYTDKLNETVESSQ